MNFRIVGMGNFKDFKGDVEAIEKVPKRGAKMIPNLKGEPQITLPNSRYGLTMDIYHFGSIVLFNVVKERLINPNCFIIANMHTLTFLFVKV